MRATRGESGVRRGGGRPTRPPQAATTRPATHRCRHRHQRAHGVGTGGSGGRAIGGRGRRREVGRTGRGRGGRGDVPRPHIHRLAGEATGRGGVGVEEIPSQQAARRSVPPPPEVAPPLEAQPRRIVQRGDSEKSDPQRRAGGQGKEGPPWPPPPSPGTLGSGRRNRSRRQARKGGTRTRTRNQRPGIAKTCRPRSTKMDGGGGGMRKTDSWRAWPEQYPDDGGARPPRARQRHPSAMSRRGRLILPAKAPHPVWRSSLWCNLKILVPY